jgi:hypothetical protein
MKGFIDKISKGSKVVLYFEILLLVQICMIVLFALRNGNVDLEDYCKEHGYNHHSGVDIVEAGD